MDWGVFDQYLPIPFSAIEKLTGSLKIGLKRIGCFIPKGPLFMKKKSSKIFPRIRWKIPQDFNQCKVRDFFHPVLYPADPTWASCWSKKHSFQIEGFMGASINNQTKTQNLHKKQNVQKIKKTKKTFQNTAPKPPKNSNPFKRTLKIPSFCVLWPLCISFSFCDPPSPLGVPRFFSNFGLEKLPELWPGHDMVEGVASLKKTLTVRPWK